MVTGQSLWSGRIPQERNIPLWPPYHSLSQSGVRLPHEACRFRRAGPSPARVPGRCYRRHGKTTFEAIAAGPVDPERIQAVSAASMTDSQPPGWVFLYIGGSVCARACGHVMLCFGFCCVFVLLLYFVVVCCIMFSIFFALLCFLLCCILWIAVFSRSLYFVFYGLMGFFLDARSRSRPGGRGGGTGGASRQCVVAVVEAGCHSSL